MLFSSPSLAPRAENRQPALLGAGCRRQWGDRDGAPYVMIGMVKYRPVERMDAHILSRIQTHRPEPPKRHRRTRG